MTTASHISVEQNALKIASPSSMPLTTWDRISTWASENKAVVYSIAGVAIVVTGASVAYYLIDSKPSTSSHPPQKKSSKKERRRKKEDGKKGQDPERGIPNSKPKAVTVEPEIELLDVDEEAVAKLSEQEKKELAKKLKLAGNTAFGAKEFPKAIKLYGQAILCWPDPIYFSNRAACYNALREWEKVIEDTTAAINLDNEYVKALNRRALAYEQLNKFSEALLDFTASCIIDGFRNELSAQSVERLLKKVAESKVSVILATKVKRLPSPTFVTNYLQSFRARPPPPGLEVTNDIAESTGKGQLQMGLRGIDKKTGDGYEEAATAFEKALELGDLGEHEAFAYNMRGTFRYLGGKSTEAIDDLTKSITLQPELTQSYIKRASMYLELGDKEAAVKDFENAIQQNNNDPDIYYHRAQLHFILGEFADAAKDYQRSIDLDRTFIFSHIQLGVTQYKMGSIASSMATFRRCIKNFDKVPDAYNYYGELLLDQQKFQEAIEKFDMAIEIEKQNKPLGINVLPLINKSLALFQWNQDFAESEKLCQQALTIDPLCDIAVATMAQLLLQQGKVSEALTYFERAAELARTENEIINALSYAEATRTQLAVQEKYPQLASRLQGMNLNAGMG
ncbi:mitochondrial precursor protein-like protein import receptor tom70 [Erysiphe pulchra]|uniref:Mitochondrial protein-like protein import receptor tom70 n=1 Tax=Erysiphe pulchra TaxID=225359 RepID=A0A2S4PWL0_9PEZI|nr:mitochondrial precursor protein-like protein import receptor tom70 [Erysiphe pulchra]